jgi:hypothetical protein
LERLQGQIDWYDRKAKADQRAYKVSKISIIGLAILIPVFAEYGFIPGFEDSRGFLVGAAAGVMCCSKGQVLNKWQENWMLFAMVILSLQLKALSGASLTTSSMRPPSLFFPRQACLSSATRRVCGSELRL